MLSLLQSVHSPEPRVSSLTRPAFLETTSVSFGTWLNSRPCTCQGKKGSTTKLYPKPPSYFYFETASGCHPGCATVAQETSNLKLPHLGLLRNWNPTPEPPSQASTIHVWNSHKNPRTSPKTTLGPLRRGNL